MPLLTGVGNGSRPGASKSASPCAKLAPQAPAVSAAAKISDATPDARLNARIIIRPTSIALRGIECFWTANPSGQRKCGQHSLCRLGDAQQKPGWSLLDPLAPRSRELSSRHTFWITSLTYLAPTSWPCRQIIL